MSRDKNRSSMDLDLYRKFLVCAQSKTYSKASEKLGLGIKYLRQKMTFLEETLGHELFVRRARYATTELTLEGERLKEKVLCLLDILEDKVDYSKVSTRDDEAYIQAIYTTQGLASHYLPDILNEYMEKDPKCSFKVITEDGPPRSITQGEIQIREGFPYAEKFKKDFLFKVRQAFWASPLYLKKYGHPKTLQDLSRHITFFSMARLDIVKIENSLLFFKPKLLSSNIDLAIQLAKKGKGIILHPDFFQDQGLVKILEDIDTIEQNIYMGYITTTPKKHRMWDFISFLRSKHAASNVP